MVDGKQIDGQTQGLPWQPFLYIIQIIFHVFSMSQIYNFLLIIFLFLNQNICCGYSKEPSQRASQCPKHMLILMGKKIFAILGSKLLFIEINAWDGIFAS